MFMANISSCPSGQWGIAFSDPYDLFCGAVCQVLVVSMGSDGTSAVGPTTANAGPFRC